MSDTEFDVVIAAYLIPDLAQQDFDGLVKLVADKQLTVEGVALVTHDADGDVTVKETGDHLGRKGMAIGGGVGLVVGLFVPPLLASVVVGGAAGALVGKFARHRVESGLEDKMGAALPPGTAGIVAIYDRAKAATVERFSRFPMRHSFLDVVRMLPAQLRRATGEIRVPDEVGDGEYDLICIGSSTWWLTMNMPMRSFLKSADAGRLLSGKPFAAFVVCRRYWGNNLKTARRLGEARGGRYLDGIYFKYPGGQVRSLLSLISYLGTGEYRDRFKGVRIPATNVQPEQVEETRRFAGALADRQFGTGQTRDDQIRAS